MSSVETSFETPLTTSKETRLQYLTHFDTVRGQFASLGDGGEPTMAAIIDWFKSCDGAYSASTVRCYRLGIREKLRALADVGEIDAKEHDRLVARLDAVGDDGARRPLPKPKGIEKQTAAKKVKSLPEHALSRLLAHLDAKAASGSEDGSFLARYVRYSLTFFPRPGEWETVRLLRPSGEAEDGLPKIVWRNSKHSNGRAHGPTRELSIIADDAYLGALWEFIQEYRVRFKKADVDHETFQERLRQALRYACIVAGVPVLCGYSLRHIGMAVAKKTMHPLDVSYAAGHVSDRTKIDAYSRSKSMGGGWLSPADAFAVDSAKRKLVRQTGRGANVAERVRVSQERRKDLKPGR
jgi:integrase